MMIVDEDKDSDEEDEEGLVDLSTVESDDSNVVVDGLGEEASNKEFIDFRVTLATYAFSTNMLKYLQIKRRVNNDGTQGQVAGILSAFTSLHNGIENDLVRAPCDRNFQSLRNAGKHICGPNRFSKLPRFSCIVVHAKIS